MDEYTPKTLKLQSRKETTIHYKQICTKQQPSLHKRLKCKKKFQYGLSASVNTCRELEKHYHACCRVCLYTKDEEGLLC